MTSVWSFVSSVLSCRQRSTASSPILVRVSTACLVQKFGVTYVAAKFFVATYVATVMTPSDDSSPWCCRANLRRSHSCRKMVGIAGQGGLIADRYRPDGEPWA